jgi:cytochrome c-type biogenesis protein
MEMTLVIAAMTLGLLAYFEPCTIATHTLFSARLNKEPRFGCCQRLMTVWLSRSVLLSGLLVLAVMLTTPPNWGPYLPSIILAVMATVYIISRLTYLPIPHIAFYKLLPGGRNFPQALQLGLTIPACTIPLFLITAGIAITVDSLWLAILAGLLFAGLFTLPMAIASWKGLHEDGQQLLSKAARTSTALTAVLLYGIAIILLMPAFDVKVMKQVLTEASLLGIGLGFLAGLVFSFNPVSFASIPVVLAYVTRAHEQRRAVLLGGAFVVGMLVTHVFLGAATALGGVWAQKLMGREWALFLGPLLILLGLIWTGWLKFRLPWLAVRGRKVSGMWGAFLLGIPFSVAVCPFCTPALLVTLTASSSIGSVPFGIGLMTAFAIGRSIPILLGAWSMGWLESLQILTHHQKKVEIIAGVTLMLTGIYLLYEYLIVVLD